MKMTLDSIVKQIINEAITPVQFLMKAIRGLGKNGAVEAENAFLRAVRREANIGPKVPVDLNNISTEIFDKSVKNIEFEAYRKIISQNYYNKNKVVIDDIVSNYKGKKRVFELNNLGIPPSFQEDVRNLSIKGKAEPKPKPTTTSDPDPVPQIVRNLGDELTDDIITGSLKKEFTRRNITYSLYASQQKAFNSVLRTLVNDAYQVVGSKEIKKYNDIVLRFNNLNMFKQRELIEKAQKAIVESGIDLKPLPRAIKNLNDYSDKQLLRLSFYKGDDIGSKLKNNLILNMGLYAVEIITNLILTGTVNQNNFTNKSVLQSILIRAGLTLLPFNIVKKINIIATAAGAIAAAAADSDKSEQLGLSPINISDARTYVESSSNPYELPLENGKIIQKVEYKAVDKKFDPMKGEKGAFIQVYVDGQMIGRLNKDLKGKINSISPD